MLTNNRDDDDRICKHLVGVEVRQRLCDPRGCLYLPRGKLECFFCLLSVTSLLPFTLLSSSPSSPLFTPLPFTFTNQFDSKLCEASTYFLSNANFSRHCPLNYCAGTMNTVIIVAISLKVSFANSFACCGTDIIDSKDNQCASNASKKGEHSTVLVSPLHTICG